MVASWGDVFAADATEACSIDIMVASAARKGALSITRHGSEVRARRLRIASTLGQWSQY